MNEVPVAQESRAPARMEMGEYIFPPKKRQSFSRIAVFSVTPYLYLHLCLYNFIAKPYLCVN